MSSDKESTKSSEKSAEKPAEKPSRDSKWLMPCITGANNEAHMTRRKLNEKSVTRSRLASNKIKKPAAKKAPGKVKVKFRSDVRKQKPASPKKPAPKKPKSGIKVKKEGKVKGTKRKTAEQNEKGNESKILPKKRKFVSEGDTAEKETNEDEDNEVDMDDDYAENDDIESNDLKKGRRRKAAKKNENVKVKIEPGSEEQVEPVKKGIPSIEDELKIIEGKGVKSTAKPKKKKAKRIRQYKPKPKKAVNKHCNFCSEKFTAELDLAVHLRYVHFKQKLLFKKEDENKNESCNPEIDSEKIDFEHGYAKEGKLNGSDKAHSTEADSENSDEDVSGSEDQAKKSNLDYIPFVVVRKVKDTDKKYCRYCGRLFLSDKGLKDHVEMRCKKVPFRCFCGKGLNYETETHTHFKDFSIPKYNKKSYSIVCEKCNKRFNFKETYENHQFECTGTEIVEIPDGKFSCSTCLLEFRNKRLLNKHERSHLPESQRPVCDICGKDFATQGGLTAHKLIHSANKQYICEHCGLGFNQKGNLMTHMKTSMGLCKGHKGVHTLMAECTICQRSFTSINRLKQHKKHHDRVEELTNSEGLCCKHCGKYFKAVPELKRHEMIHTGEKPHKCSFCYKAFAQKSNMMAHMRIHTGYRPYECYICGQGFSQGTNLKQHVEKNHDYRTYKFKRLPRGRKGKDTSTAELPVDIEMEYIEKAKKEGTVDHMPMKREGSRGPKMTATRVNSKVQRDMGVQAEDSDDYDDDEVYEDSESEEETPLPTQKRVVHNTSATDQKILLQIVQDQAQPGKNVHIPLDTNTLRQVLAKTLTSAAMKLPTSVSRASEIHVQTKPTYKVNTTEKPTYSQAHYVSLPTGEKKVYTMFPSETEREVAQVIQAISEQGNIAASKLQSENPVDSKRTRTEADIMQVIQSVSDQSANRASQSQTGERLVGMNQTYAERGNTPVIEIVTDNTQDEIVYTEIDSTTAVQTIPEPSSSTISQSHANETVYMAYPHHSQMNPASIVQTVTEQPNQRYSQSQIEEAVYTIVQSSAYSKQTETNPATVIQTLSEQPKSTIVQSSNNEKIYTVLPQAAGMNNLQILAEQTENLHSTTNDQQYITVYPKASAAQNVQVIQTVTEETAGVDLAGQTGNNIIQDEQNPNLYTVYPKSSVAEEIQVVQSINAQDEVNKAQVVETVVNPAGEQMVVLPPDINRDQTYTHSMTTIKTPAQPVERYGVPTSTSYAQPNVVIDAESASAVAELQQDQAPVEHVPNKVETYEVTDEENQSVEYVTVIFEEDVDPVEQEIAISQTNEIVPENALTNTSNAQPQIHSITVDGDQITATEQLTAVLGGNTEQERSVIEMIRNSL